MIVFIILKFFVIWKGNYLPHFAFYRPSISLSLCEHSIYFITTSFHRVSNFYLLMPCVFLKFLLEMPLFYVPFVSFLVLEIQLSLYYLITYD